MEKVVDESSKDGGEMQNVVDKSRKDGGEMEKVADESSKDGGEEKKFLSSQELDDLTASQIDDILNNASQAAMEKGALKSPVGVSSNLSPSMKRVSKPSVTVRTPFTTNFESSGDAVAEGAEPADVVIGLEDVGDKDAIVDAGEKVPKALVKGRCPLDENMGEGPGIRALLDWLNDCLVEGFDSQSPNRHLEEDDKVEPSLKLGVCEVKSKSWFHSLYYVDEYLASSHIDVLFYYLRKKFLYGHSAVTFTTTNLIFDRCIKSIYKKFCQVNKRKEKHFDLSMINVNTTVVDYIIGYDITCGRPWSEVDHILFPIHCIDMEYWVMGRLSVKERTIYLYNFLKWMILLKLMLKL